MNDGFSIDPATVRSAAAAFTSVGDQLSGVFAQLSTAIESAGRCWGGDQYGTSFEKEYLPARDSAVKFFPGLAKVVGDMGAGLAELADTAERAESANTDKFLP